MPGQVEYKAEIVASSKLKEKAFIFPSSVSFCIYRVLKQVEKIMPVSLCPGSSDRSGDGLSFEANSLRQSKRKRKPPSALEEAAGGSAGGSWVKAASK